MSPDEREYVARIVARHYKIQGLEVPGGGDVGEGLDCDDKLTDLWNRVHAESSPIDETNLSVALYTIAKYGLLPFLRIPLEWIPDAPTPPED